MCWIAFGIFDFLSTSSLILVILFHFTFNADCLSTDRSHIHCYVEVMFELFTHTFNGNRVIPDHVSPFSGELEEVLMKLAVPILSCGLMSMCVWVFSFLRFDFFWVCHWLPPVLTKNKSYALRLSREKVTDRSRSEAGTVASWQSGDTHCIIWSLDLSTSVHSMTISLSKYLMFPESIMKAPWSSWKAKQPTWDLVTVQTANGWSMFQELRTLSARRPTDVWRADDRHHDVVNCGSTGHLHNDSENCDTVLLSISVSSNACLNFPSNSRETNFNASASIIGSPSE